MAASASFFSAEEKESLLTAIKEAEKDTSGEIRLHIEATCNGEVLDRAAWVFKKMSMEKTAQRNGVLFYLAVQDRKFAIIGDGGINAKVPAGFWDSISELLSKNFREGKFTEGLSEGIRLAGKQLKTHFPYLKSDVNELPDDISFEKIEGEKE